MDVQPLYLKVEKYKRNSSRALAIHPDRVIDETWLIAGEDGSIETADRQECSILKVRCWRTHSCNSGVLAFTAVATGM